MENNDIKKALECCKAPMSTECKSCPRYNDDIGADNALGIMTTMACMESLMRDAYEVIISQEQRIGELTEENERLRAIPEQMKERLQAYLGTYVLGYKIPLSEALKAVNQIAKEMLDGEK